MTNDTADFNPLAGATALAKFCIAEDRGSFDSMIAGCGPEELRLLEDSCAALALSLAHQVYHDVQRERVDAEGDGSKAIHFARLACYLQILRYEFGGPSDMEIRRQLAIAAFGSMTDAHAMGLTTLGDAGGSSG